MLWIFFYWVYFVKKLSAKEFYVILIVLKSLNSGLNKAGQQPIDRYESSFIWKVLSVYDSYLD